MITRQFPQFKVDLAGELQRPPYNWVGGTAWQLIRKYPEAISTFWANGALVSDVAEFIHTRHMEETAPKAFSFPTMESLKKVGCKFD